MPVFYGELQERREAGRIPAVVTIDQDTIRLTSGETELGEWKLHQVRIEAYTDSSAVFRADDAELILFLDDHQRFMSVTERYQRTETRSRPTHPAFRKDEPGNVTGKEIRQDVSREVSSIREELEELSAWIKPGPQLWIGLGALLVAVLIIPQVVIGLLLLVGVLGLAVGALAYADTRTAVRLPDAFTPRRRVGIGAVGIVLGILISIIR